MIKPTLIGLNPAELKYYPFMISLDKSTGSFNVLSSKETKDINFKAFHIITNKNKAKTMGKHISLIENANSIVQHVIQIKNGTIKHVNVNVKIIVSAKNIIGGILTHVLE